MRTIFVAPSVLGGKEVNRLITSAEVAGAHLLSRTGRSLNF